jgi:hypothetical protein
MRFRYHLKTKRTRNGERLDQPDRDRITEAEAFSASFSGNRMVGFVI